MQNLPLFGTGIRSISDIVTRQRRVNCIYDIRVDQDRASVVLLGTPGSDQWVFLTDSPIRGWRVVGELMYVCAGERLYAITKNGASTPLVNGITGSGPVSMSDNSAQLIIVTGGAGFVYDISSSVLTTITDTYFPVGATSVIFLNGRFVVEKPGTRQFYVSGLLDGLNWTYLGSTAIFGSKENSSDLLVRVGNVNGQLVLYGTQSIEFWQDVGASPLPYQRINGATQSWGLAATLSTAAVGNTEYFLGFSPNGGLAVIRLNGYAPEPVSDSDLNTLFSSFATVSDAVALTYTVYGHPIYQITFPSENRSFAYDVKTNIWHEAQSGVEDQGRHFARYGITFGGKNYVSDETSGVIYYLDKDIYTENGSKIKRQVFTRHVRDQGNTLSISELFLDFETGNVPQAPRSPVGEESYTVPGTYTFTVPDYVTSVCVVAVGGGGGGQSWAGSGFPGQGVPGGTSRFGTLLYAYGGDGGGRSTSGGNGFGGLGGNRSSATGGNGGRGGSCLPLSSVTGGGGGGGGAGGYTTSGSSFGNGGDGASVSFTGSVSGSPGSGGSGGGGGAYYVSPSEYEGGGGGGVGIFGVGASGAAGGTTLSTVSGKGGSGGGDAVFADILRGNGGGLYGGGGGVSKSSWGDPGAGGGGGGLGYLNHIPVSPGEAYTVVVGSGGSGFGGSGGSGAVRVLWGDGREFPGTRVQPLPSQGVVPVAENPQVMLRISRDGGRTFGNERWVPLGRIGEYYSRVMLRRLGSARDFVIQITVTDPVKFVLASGSVSLEGEDA